MAYSRTTLAVLTLLQLSRAEISDKQPESWYSANVISDGFQPKPISEIFSTEPPFKSTNPIILVPKSNAVPDEILLLSTLMPPTRKFSSTVTTSGEFTKVSMPTLTESTPLPPTVQEQFVSQSLPELQPQSQTIPQPQSTPQLPAQVQTQPDSQPQLQPLPQQKSQPQIQPPLQQQPQTQLQPLPQQQPQPQIQPLPEQQPQPQIQTQPQQQPQPQTQPPPQQQPKLQIQPLPQEEFQPQTELLAQQQPQPDIPPLPQLQPIEVEVQSQPQQTSQPEPMQTTQSQSRQPETPSQQTQSQQIRFELVPQQAPSPPELIPQLPQAIPPQPNLTQSSTTSPQSNYFLIYQQAPQSIQGYPQQVQQPSVSTPVPETIITRRQVMSTPPQRIPVIASKPIPSAAPVPFFQSVPITRLSTVPNWTTRSGRTNANTDLNIQPLLTTPIPPVPPVVPPSNGMFPIKIRVVAPSGSITNVRINPTSTTRKPTTTRTRRTNRPKNNSYDVCIDACKGRKDPICGAPLSANPVDPNTLKGFPSVCHMACHNSFRKQRYEKLIDGRCGRLRTRIRTVDSNSKLKRNELNKAQYFIDNTGPNTVVEFSGALLP